MPGKYRKGTGSCEIQPCTSVNNCWGTGTEGSNNYKRMKQITTIDCNHNQKGPYYELGPKKECLMPWLNYTIGYKGEFNGPCPDKFNYCK